MVGIPAPEEVRASISFEKRVDDLYHNQANTLLDKNIAYGPKAIADAPGGALNGVRVRLHDKWCRLNNLLDNTEFPFGDETVEDTLGDMMNYCAIGLMVLRGQWLESTNQD